MTIKAFCCYILAFTLTTWVAAVNAEEFHYHYVSLDVGALRIEPPPVVDPSSFIFFDPAAIVNGGRVYGTFYTCVNVCAPEVAVYAHGTLTRVQPGRAVAANNEGTIGGSVVVDPVLFNEQAALFHEDKVTLIPRQPGEFSSHVMQISDSGLAIIQSVDVNGNPTYFLYRHGQETLINLGVRDIFGGQDLQINDEGSISGTALYQVPAPPTLPFGSDRAFVFSRTGVTTLLNPLPTDQDSWGLAINRHGGVLGYSFTNGKALEHIGIWNRHGNFQTYFTEGTKEIPTVSNRLLFNERNLIVITRTTDGNSYVVPERGVRLNLADITDGVPPSVVSPLQIIVDMNDRGDMIGLNVFGTSTFLLERTDEPRQSEGE
jgi:hypothetical protein